jgi:hypothetical protein
MSIIGNLPANLTNGSTADATQVMSDLNFIVNQVNANATPLGTLTAPSGTRVLFQQASPPVGWSADTSAAMTDCTVRINSATAGGTGGTAGWGTWNAQTLNINAFTLSIAQLPAHTHTDAGHTHGVTDPTHTHGVAGGGAILTNQSSANVAQQGGAYSAQNLANAATGISINTGVANIQNTGSGAVIQPTYTVPNIKYADFVMGVKQ